MQMISQQDGELKSMCRLCSGNCGTILTMEGGRIVRVRGDREHVFSRGYACSRGLQVPEALNSPDRLLHPLKRTADGRFQRIPLEVAFDEIAERLSAIMAASGNHAVGLFKGTHGYLNASASQMWRDWMVALGSPNYFTTNTIDQSSHLVTMLRMGHWDAGRHRLADSDVVLMVGTNPLVSLGAYAVLAADPSKRLKDMQRRGLKLIVIDPRKTETAHQADCHIQPVPGEDATILAGIIRIVLENGWHDTRFCEEFVDGLSELRRAVAPYTKEYVARRAGVATEQIEVAATLFARNARRGIAVVGTGGTMGPHSNLVDHLGECLNAICGRYYRAGDIVPNPGVTVPKRDYRAQVVPAYREWEHSAKSGTGHGEMLGERMSGILADEMLAQDAHRIRALFVNAGNPAVSLPDQEKAIAGLRSLDLLVTVDPFMTATAQLSDYVLPPRMFYERADVAPGPDLDVYLNPFAFGQYLPPAVAVPADSDLAEEWRIYWELAKRLKVPITFAGCTMDVDREPTTEEMFAILLRNARIPLERIKLHPNGHIFDEASVAVLLKDDGADGRLQLAPADIVSELEDVLQITPAEGIEEFPYRLIVRRMRTLTNSFGRTFHETRRRSSFNPLYIHPDDLMGLGMEPGDRVRVVTDSASIPAALAPDPSLRRGVVAMAHCWGMLPGEAYEDVGVATSRLVRTDVSVEPINAMPMMTAIPVRLTPDHSAAPR